jgi:coenzyme PQQ synthesis protein D (PqqD)
MPANDRSGATISGILAYGAEGERRVTDKLDTRNLSRNPKIEEAPLQGELMLFDPATSKFFVMNPTMAFLWRKCERGQSLSAIIETMALEFSDVDPAVAEADLRKALDELMILGLLVSEPRAQ